MNNTAKTTAREGRQSSDNTYVRIAAAKHCGDEPENFFMRYL